MPAAPHAGTMLRAALLLGALLCCAPAARACTTLSVGAGATGDNSVYIARTEDTSFSNNTQVCRRGRGLGQRGVSAPAGSTTAPRPAPPPPAPVPAPRVHFPTLHALPCLCPPQNLYFHPARDAPWRFRSNDNNMSATLPAPGLAYIAAPVATSLTDASPDPTVSAPGWLVACATSLPAFRRPPASLRCAALPRRMAPRQALHS